MAHSGKFNSQIHVEYTWETPQDMYDSEDDLDDRVCENMPIFITSQHYIFDHSFKTVKCKCTDMQIILIYFKYYSFLRQVLILRDLGLRLPLLAAMGTSPLPGALLKASLLGHMRTLTSSIVTLQTTAHPLRAPCHLLYPLKQYREVRYGVIFKCS